MVEFIMGMTAGVTVALVAVFLFAPVENWVFTKARRSGVSDAQMAITRMLKEIRRIKAPGQIQTFTAEQLSFVDIENAAVTFQKTGTDLMRNGDVLARNVQGLVFTYLDKDGNVAAAAGQIRVMRVELAIVSGNQTVRLRSAARIRNLP